MPRTRNDCPICGKKDLSKLLNNLADIHRLSSVERRFYLDNTKSPNTEEEDYDIMSRSERAKMDYYDEAATAFSDSGDIFDSDEEEEEEYSNKEEESSSKDEGSSSEKSDSNEKEDNSGEDDSSSKDGSSKDGSTKEDDSCEESEGEDQSDEYEEDPWQTLIDEPKRQLFDEFQENVENQKV